MTLATLFTALTILVTTAQKPASGTVRPDGVYFADFGKDAYGVVDVDGKGAVQLIVKPHGSGGTADPLDQRATVGAKVTAYAAVILNDLWLVKIEHAVS